MEVYVGHLEGKRHEKTMFNICSFFKKPLCKGKKWPNTIKYQITWKAHIRVLGKFRIFRSSYSARLINLSLKLSKSTFASRPSNIWAASWLISLEVTLKVGRLIGQNHLKQYLVVIKQVTCAIDVFGAFTSLRLWRKQHPKGNNSNQNPAEETWTLKVPPSAGGWGQKHANKRPQTSASEQEPQEQRPKPKQKSNKKTRQRHIQSLFERFFAQQPAVWDFCACHWPPCANVGSPGARRGERKEAQELWIERVKGKID